jgi:hypothetical protein
MNQRFFVHAGEAGINPATTPMIIIADAGEEFISSSEV